MKIKEAMMMAAVVVAAVVWADASLVGKRVHRISMSKTVSVTKYKMAAAVAAMVATGVVVTRGGPDDLFGLNFYPAMPHCHRHLYR